MIRILQSLASILKPVFAALSISAILAGVGVTVAISNGWQVGAWSLLMFPLPFSAVLCWMFGALAVTCGELEDGRF